MFKKILLGASALTVGLAFATGAMANPTQSFSDGNTNTVNSAAIAGGAAASESFNSSQNAVSTQDLSALTIGVALDVSLLEVPVLSGNATAAGNVQRNASGVVSTNVNTGMSAINQQATSIGAIGNVSFQ